MHRAQSRAPRSAPLPYLRHRRFPRNVIASLRRLRSWLLERPVRPSGASRSTLAG